MKIAPVTVILVDVMNMRDANISHTTFLSAVDILVRGPWIALQRVVRYMRGETHHALQCNAGVLQLFGESDADKVRCRKIRVHHILSAEQSACLLQGAWKIRKKSRTHLFPKILVLTHPRYLFHLPAGETEVDGYLPETPFAEKLQQAAISTISTQSRNYVADDSRREN